MGTTEPKFTIGIEEEYLLVDRETRALVIEPPQNLMSECEELIGEQVSSELLQSQIEVGTKVCNNVQEAHTELTHLRKVIVDVAANHNLASPVLSGFEIVNSPQSPNPVCTALIAWLVLLPLH